MACRDLQEISGWRLVTSPGQAASIGEAACGR